MTFEIATIFFEDKKVKSLILMLWIKNYLVNLVCLGHNNTVPLNNHCVCVHPALKSDDDDVKYFGHLDFDDFVSPLILTLMILSLMISTLIHIILTLMILSHRWFLLLIILSLILMIVTLNLMIFLFILIWWFCLTADCVLQSCPPIVKSSLANSD